METKRSASLIAAFFALFYPLLAFAQQTQQPTGPQQPPWGWPGPWHMWSGGWGFWWIFPLFMFILCIAVFFRGHRSGGGHHCCGPGQRMERTFGPGRAWGDPAGSALQILNERFAKGEIQKQEYEEKKSAILSNGPH